ncbi:MAG TPA: substrate-binding domain-containing protein [Mucilaginibacter sp.]|nr:substrate-binding domain-containing protein [Mucilaginibacter sp.]
MKTAELTGVKEIARLANVSIGTVDRVIHNRKGVSDATRQKINKIIEEINYQPNKMASLLASKKIVNIAVVIPRVSNETDYWTFPLNGIEQAGEEVKQFGITIQYFFYDLDSHESFNKAAEELLNCNPQGILLAPSFIDESTALVKRINELNIPFVFINSDLPKQPSLSYIGPELYQSGRLAAQLTKLSIAEEDEIMIINISADLENDHHLIRKEQGFRSYFNDQQPANPITTLNIYNTHIESVEKSFLEALQQKPNVKAFFVTNSRVNIVAKILKKHNKTHLLVGYDFLKSNINYLKDGQINFLICQRPKEQGYLAIMALYKYLFNISEPEKAIYMPIDIITKENYQFYNS